MKQYLDLLTKVLNEGSTKTDRTGTGTISCFGAQIRFDLANGFPLLTTKRVHYKSVIHELLWMIEGRTDVKYLNDRGVTIWDEWVDGHGRLGPIYGKQWRDWDFSPDRLGFDQLYDAQKALRDDPDSRRIIVNSWNVADLQYMQLPPCHVMYQFYSANGKLSCHMYQRSADLFLGVPFNIASYSLLTHMMAQTTGHKPGELIISFGDVHIYSNHMPQVLEQLSRKPKPLPVLKLDKNIESIFDFRYGHIQIKDYNPHPRIIAQIAV